MRVPVSEANDLNYLLTVKSISGICFYKALFLSMIMLDSFFEA